MLAQRQSFKAMALNRPPAIGNTRPVYLRLMRRKAQEGDLANEAQELRDLLLAAPGVVDAQVRETHPKGGYRVTLELTWSALDAFIAYLDLHGWMSAM